jgi:hypothetical protein
MEMKILRQQGIEILRLISSVDKQIEYERDVPIANVPSELVCQWFDDFYHPRSPQFKAAFDAEELNRLADFNDYFHKRFKNLPGNLEEMHRCEEWREIQVRAGTLVEWLASRDGS